MCYNSILKRDRLHCLRPNWSVSSQIARKWCPQLMFTIDGQLWCSQFTITIDVHTWCSPLMFIIDVYKTIIDIHNWWSQLMFRIWVPHQCSLLGISEKMKPLFCNIPFTREGQKIHFCFTDGIIKGQCPKAPSLDINHNWQCSVTDISFNGPLGFF